MMGRKLSPSRRSLLVGGTASALLAASPGAARAAAIGSPDAELIQACMRFTAFHALPPEPHGVELVFGTPECDAHEAEMETWVGDGADMLRAIAGTPARTLEGMRAKVKALLVWDDECRLPRTEFVTDVLATSVLRDLLDGAA